MTTPVHDYLSTACGHAQLSGDPSLHNSCRNSCKFCDSPCTCSCHREGARTESPVSWVDQARGIAIRLHDALQAAGVDLATVDRHLAQAITEDRSLFWLRGEAMPPVEWRDASEEEA